MLLRLTDAFPWPGWENESCLLLAVSIPGSLAWLTTSYQRGEARPGRAESGARSQNQNQWSQRQARRQNLVTTGYKTRIPRDPPRSIIYLISNQEIFAEFYSETWIIFHVSCMQIRFIQFHWLSEEGMIAFIIIIQVFVCINKKLE